MDQLTGRAGADGFFFGFEALDGIRIGTNVMDYEVGVDSIALVEGMSVSVLRQADKTVIPGQA